MAIDVQSIKQIFDGYERTRLQNVKTAESLSFLVSQGRATCQDLKKYDLLAMATFSFQMGALQSLRAAGVENLPAAPPSPLLFSWKGVPGTQAHKFDCTQGLSGSLSDVYASPEDVAMGFPEIDPKAVSSTEIDKTVQEIASEDNLGLAPVVVIVIAGVVISLVAIAATVISDWLGDMEKRKETLGVVEKEAKQHSETLAARAACFSICLDKKNSPSECTKACATTLPDFDPNFPLPPSSMGVLGIVGIVAIVGGIGYSVYKRAKER